jgi:hypothetical protein
MKSVLTLLSFLFCLTISRAQETDLLTLPPIVSDLFNLLYPDAKSVEWQLAGDRFKAVFKNNKMNTEAWIDADGKLWKTCTQIKTCALPESALDYFTSVWAEEKIDIAMITEDQKGIMTFTAVIDKTQYTFDAEGQMVDVQGLVYNALQKAE